MGIAYTMTTDYTNERAEENAPYSENGRSLVLETEYSQLLQDLKLQVQARDKLADEVRQLRSEIAYIGRQVEMIDTVFTQHVQAAFDGRNRMLVELKNQIAAYTAENNTSLENTEEISND